MAEQWIDWHPKVGDIKPAGYRYWSRICGCWVIGAEQGFSVNSWEAENTQYQIPAPVVKPPEDRPPWIDPQCKFRWGDRVKVKSGSRVGPFAYVINPKDMTEHMGGLEGFTVLIARSLSCTLPYKTSAALDMEGNWSPIFDKVREDDLELFPEDLPRHFDDRLLDADQPQEQPKIARVPREIWVNMYPGMPGGAIHETRTAADILSAEDRVECIHFREVL